MTTGTTTTSVRAPDGVRLHTEVTGAGDLTLVLAHGWALASATWEPLLAELSEVGARVVRYDQRGHGRSAGHDTETGSVSTLGHDLAAVIEQVGGERCVIVAHSMGGMALLSLAAERPDLVDGRIAGAVLVSTAAGDLNSVHLNVPLPLRPVVAACFPEVMARLHPLAGERRPRLTRVVDHLTRRSTFGAGVPSELVRTAAALVGSTPAVTVRSCWKAMRRYDAVQGVRRLRGLPVRVAVGSRDGLTPVGHAKRLAAELGAPLVVVPGAGHMLHLEAPDVVAAETLAVLRELEPAGAAW